MVEALGSDTAVRSHNMLKMAIAAGTLANLAIAVVLVDSMVLVWGPALLSTIYFEIGGLICMVAVRRRASVLD